MLLATALRPYVHLGQECIEPFRRQLLRHRLLEMTLRPDRIPGCTVTSRCCARHCQGFAPFGLRSDFLKSLAAPMSYKSRSSIRLRSAARVELRRDETNDDRDPLWFADVSGHCILCSRFFRVTRKAGVFGAECSRIDTDGNDRSRNAVRFFAAAGTSERSYKYCKWCTAFNLYGFCGIGARDV